MGRDRVERIMEEVRQMNDKKFNATLIDNEIETQTIAKVKDFEPMPVPVPLPVPHNIKKMTKKILDQAKAKAKNPTLWEAVTNLVKRIGKK